MDLAAKIRHTTEMTNLARTLWRSTPRRAWLLRRERRRDYRRWRRALGGLMAEVDQRSPCYGKARVPWTPTKRG